MNLVISQFCKLTKTNKLHIRLIETSAMDSRAESWAPSFCLMSSRPKFSKPCIFLHPEQKLIALIYKTARISRLLMLKKNLTTLVS